MASENEGAGGGAVSIEVFETSEEARFDAKDWRGLIELYESSQGLSSEMTSYWDRLQGFLTLLADELDNEADQLELHLAMGRIWEERLERYDLAVQSYQNALRVDPTGVEPLQAAERVYRRVGRPDMVVRMLQKQLERAQKVESQAAIIREIGRTYLLDLNDPPAAMARLTVAATLTPDDEEIERLIAVAKGEALPEPAPVDHDLAVTTRMRALHSGEGVPSLKAAPAEDTLPEYRVDTDEHPPAKEVLALASGAHETVEPELEAAEPAEPAEPDASVDREEAVTAELEAVPAVAQAEVRVEPEPQVSVVDESKKPEAVEAEESQEPEPGEPETPEVPGAGEPEASEVPAGGLGDVDMGSASRATLVASVEQALAEGASPAVFAAAGQRAGNANRGDLLRAALDGLVDAATGDDEVAALAARAAALEGLADEDAALASWQAVLERESGHPDALWAVRRICESRQDWGSLIELYSGLKRQRRLVRQLDFDPTLELADLLWRRFGDLDEAETHFKRLRLSDPKNPRMLAFYVEHYRRQGDWKRLLATLQTLRNQAETPKERLELARELAVVAESELGQPERAIEVWKQIHAEQPSTESATALRRLYTQTQKYNGLLEFLKGEAKRGDDDEVERRVELLFEIADIYGDHLKFPTSEAHTLAEILAIDPGNQRAAEALVTRYETTQSWGDLVSLLEKQAQAEDDPEAEATLRRRIAAIWRAELGNISHAVPQLERVAELEPDNRGVLGELRSIYASRSETQPLLNVLEREAELVEGEERLDVLREMASLARERLSDDAETVRIASRLLDESDGRDPMALAVLEDIYRRRGSWDELARVLEARRAAVDSRDDEVAVLLSLGDLLETRMGDPERALSTFAEALEVDPSSQKAVERIIALHLEASRWDELEALCRDRGDLARLCELLEAAAEAAAEVEDEVALRRREARVAADDLHEPERVMRAYEAILRRRPDDLGVTEALVPYYEGAGEHRKLVGVLERLAEARPGAEGAGLARRLAEVWEADLADAGQAFAWSAQAVARAPGEAASRRELERLGRDLFRLDDVVTRLRTAAGGASGKVKLELLRQAARLASTDLAETHAELAAELFETISGLEPGDQEALDALEALYGQAGDDAALLSVLRRRLEHLRQTAADPEAALALQLTIAGVQSDRLGDLEAAIATYREVLDVDPVNPEALEKLKRAHFKRDEWEAVVEVGRRQLDAVPEQRALVLFELGQVQEYKLEDVSAAVELYAELVERHPDSELRDRAIETLRALMDSDQEAARVAEVLEPVYRQAEDWSSLARVLGIRVETDETADPLRVQRMRELADLYERRLGDTNAAFDWLRRATAEEPTRETWFDDLERLADDTGEWSAVAEFHREAFEASPENLLIGRRLARVLEGRLGSLDEAIDAWRRIYDDNPMDEEAIEALDRLYVRTGDVDALVSLLEVRADNAGTDEERKSSLFRICDVLQNEGRAMEAQPYYQRVFDMDQTDERAFEALRVLLDAGEDWGALSALLETRLTLCQPDEMDDLRMQLGSLREGVLDEPYGAVEAYREVLVDDLANEAASDALRRLFRERIDDLDLAELRDQIYHTLRTTFEMREAWEELVALEALQLEDPGKELVRADHHQQMAEILRDRLDRPREAFGHFADALRADFENTEVRGEAERLAESLEAWPELVGLYEEGVEAVDDELVRVDLYRRLARLADQRTGQQDLAVASYEAVRESRPDDREALDALERLYEARGVLEDLVEVRQHKANLTSGSERLGLLRKNAETLREGLRDLLGAVETNHLILAERPGDGEALDTLEELYEELGQWESLVQILLDKVELAPTAEERRLLYQQIATVREDRLGDVDGAIDSYIAMLDVDPTDATALVALERLYESTERWHDLAGILRRRMDLFDDRAYRSEIALRLGGVLETQLEDRTGAIALYREVLEHEAGNMHAVISLEAMLSDPEQRLASIDVLLPVYEQSEMWSDVVRLLEARLAVPEGRLSLDQRLDTLLRIREVNEERLQDVTSAFAAACRAYEVAPKGNLREQAERLAQHTGDFEALAGAYENAKESAETDDSALLIHMRLAELYLTQLGRMSEAEGHFREALEIEPRHLQALEALETLYIEQDRPNELLEILERRVELARDTDEIDTAIIFLYRLADLHERSLAQPGEAMAAWRRCLELSPSDERAFAGLNRLYRATERWPDLVDLLSEQLTHAASEEQVAELRHEQALVLADNLKEPAAGLETWAEVLRLAPDHPGAIEALEGLVESLAESDPELAARAAELLEPHYRRGEAWGLLAAVLEQRAVVAEAPRAADLLTEAAELHEQRLGDPDGAFELYGRIFTLTPQRQAVWAELERLARSTGAWPRLAALLEEGIERAEGLTDRELPGLGLLLGRIVDDALSDQNRARRAFELVVDIEPDNETALDALERLYSQIPDWEELVALYRRRADLVEAPSERLPYLLKIGRLQEELEDPDASVTAYRSVLDVDAMNPEAQASLERLFGLEERYEDLAELLDRRSSLVELDAERADILHRLGRVLEVDLGSFERAVPVYRRALAIEPEHNPTIRALEALLSQLRLERGEDAVRMTIIETLEGVYDPTSRWTGLVELCEARLEIVEDVTARVQALHRAAELAERHGGDQRMAFELHARAFREDPGHTGTREQLERLVVETRSWAALAETYVDGLTKLQDQQVAVTLMLRTAELFETQLSEPEGAVRVLEELLEIDPRNLEALGRLDRLYRELGRYEQLVAVLQRKVEVSDDVLDQKEFLYQVADIQEKRLTSVDDAAETFRRILELDPEDIVALGSLERLLRKSERWTALVDILLNKVEIVDDEVERRAVYLDMAQVYERSLEDPTAAIGVYRTLLANDPTDTAAIDALDRLYVETEAWGELLDVIEVRRGLAPDDDALDALDLRSARVLSESLQDVPRAIEVYRTVLERTRHQPKALEALTELLEGEYAEAAMGVLEPLYRTWGNWEHVVWLLQNRVARESDASRRHIWLREIAQLAEQRLGRPDAAFSALTNALNEEPEDDETLGELLRLADDEDLWEPLADALDAVAAGAQNPEIQRKLRLRSAAIHERELAQTAPAVERYQQVLETHPHDRQALKALDRLLFNDRDWEALADVLAREIEIADSEDEEIDLRFRLGYIREMVFMDAPGAIELYAEALELRPDDDKSLGSLARLQETAEHSRAATEVLESAYLQTRSWAELAGIYAVALDHEAEPERRAELMRKAGALSEDELQQPERAFAQFAGALQEVPDAPDVMVRLESLADALGTWPDLAAAYDEVRGDIASIELRLQVLGKLAGWYEERLERPELAEARYREVLEQDPENDATRDRLEALYEREAMHGELFELWAERADRADDPDEQRSLLGKMARLAEDTLADPRRTAEVYERLRRLDEDNLDVTLELVRLYGQLGDVARLVDALGYQAALEDDDDKKASLYSQIAQYAEAQLADAARAAEAYARAIELRPDLDVRYDRLEALYHGLEDWEALRGLLAGRLELESGDEALAVTARLAKVLEERFEDLDGAIGRYEQAVEDGPVERWALDELARLQARDERWGDLDGTYGRLEALLREQEDDHRLDLLQLLQSRASLRASRLGDGAGAIAVLRDLLELDPNQRQALDTLGSLLEEEEAWADALEIVTRQIALIEETRALADLYQRRARLLEATDAPLGEVIQALERALACDERRIDVARSLLERYREAERWDDVWSSLSFLLQAEESEDVRRELAVEAARVARDKLADPARLVEALELAHELDADDLGVVDELAGAYLEVGNHAGAAPLIDRLVEARESKATKRDMARLHHLRGRVAQGMGDAQAAEASFVAAYECDAGFLPNLMSLAKLRYQQEELEESLRLFQTMLLQQMRLKSPADRVDIFYHMGRLMLAKGDRRRARDMFMRALSIDRGHEPSKAGLAELE